ncbi:MAG: response regulator [Chromatiaceae bacterium]|jgi:DNA-binding response OmpR family regulator|nr:response regulator [Chromatiaceae bacterium]
MNPGADRSAGASAAERRPRVLLIEDDLALGRMLTWELEERGIETVLAGSCAEALRAAESARFDLMLVDADLPDGDGVRLAEHLAGTRGDTTVVIYSGRHGIRGACAEHPAVHAVLTKPVRVWEILALLQTSTPSPAPASTERGASRSYSG